MRYLADFLQIVCSRTGITAGFQVLMDGIRVIHVWTLRQNRPMLAPIPIQRPQRWSRPRSPIEAPLPLKQRHAYPRNSQGFR